MRLLCIKTNLSLKGECKCVIGSNKCIVYGHVTWNSWDRNKQFTCLLNQNIAIDVNKIERKKFVPIIITTLGVRVFFLHFKRANQHQINQPNWKQQTFNYNLFDLLILVVAQFFIADTFRHDYGASVVTFKPFYIRLWVAYVALGHWVNESIYPWLTVQHSPMTYIKPSMERTKTTSQLPSAQELEIHQKVSMCALLCTTLNVMAIGVLFWIIWAFLTVFRLQPVGCLHMVSVSKFSIALILSVIISQEV